MAWWLCREYSYAGPDFDWVDPDGVPEKRGLVGGGLSLSRRLSPNNVPSVARCRRPYPKPPTVDVFFVDYAVAVTERFRDLVESFEPSIHLFVPIELQFINGMPMDGSYYFFNCNVDVDCLITQNKPEWFRDYGNGRVIPELHSIQKLSPLEIFISLPQIEGRHLWTGGVLGWNQLFVSNEFCNALRKGRFRAIEIRRQCHEVDRPWIAEENMGPLLEKWKSYVANGRDIEMGWI